ncbi:DUF4438 domain-containing protein [Desulfonema ishimotonii]|uniref:DUF4438 domain-containing protein n=1 Tax=Desulfonema ishimotonii TaxID=45657 RepID=A0A401FTZ1_9BACT|nr:DUF4438 domain-containing protein [Desulfonema ishimotonii]GBC60423.1 DUF4438 domain-containing protein [Desulfonema ishimotonii]
MRVRKAGRTGRPGTPAMNLRDLVMITVSGQIAHPIGRASPYRIGHDGVPRVLPGSGGIVISHRIGDRCVGLAGDHVEPGVSLHNNKREIVGKKNAPNLALITYACVGNTAEVMNGPCKGKKGLVTGKHGGVAHLMIDFPTSVLRRLRIGDGIQINAHGLGLRFIGHPRVSVFSCAPGLIRRWGIRSVRQRIEVPVTHRIPASIMGSGIGKSSAVRGDFDIQLFDPDIRRRYKLGSLRFGDFVAILHSDTRFGRAYRRGMVTIGVIVHSDSTVSGHGPGVMTLLTGPLPFLRPVRDRNANLAAIYRIRSLLPARAYRPLVRTKMMRKQMRYDI